MSFEAFFRESNCLESGADSWTLHFIADSARGECAVDRLDAKTTVGVSFSLDIDRYFFPISLLFLGTGVKTAFDAIVDKLEFG